LRLKNFQRVVQILLETETFQHCTLASDQKANHENVFYVDALKACLIASLQSDMTANKSGNKKAGLNKSSTEDSVDNIDSLSDNDFSGGYEENSESSANAKGTKDVVAPVVKLVATSLIANGHILEGVELLNFISKTSDSC